VFVTGENNLKAVPKQLNGAMVVLSTSIDARHSHTGKCRQIVAGVVQGPAAGLAICQYSGEQAYYLFGCDAEWNIVTDTWHESLGDALRQAEFEYSGVCSTWRTSAH
jgi:hypothetical protein